MHIGRTTILEYCKDSLPNIAAISSTIATTEQVGPICIATGLVIPPYEGVSSGGKTATLEVRVVPSPGLVAGTHSPRNRFVCELEEVRTGLVSWTEAA